ncbi:MAG: Smr/MutS family protein [Bacteroidetes bacterium]|nr:Smr/MutS family protein [Bacteroidota bacterium]
MLYPTSFENKLGFDHIRELLSSNCLSSMGKDLISTISFSTNSKDIFLNLVLCGEMLNVLNFEEGFPSQDYYDLLPELKRILTPGTYLEEETISELRLSLQTVAGLINFFSMRMEAYPFLYGQIASTIADSSALTLPAALISRIDHMLDERSEVRDNASPELSKLRKEKAFKIASVEHKIHHDLKVARQSGWTPEDAEVTIRNGRLVIPMLSAHKRKISGYVHDESATGQTVFIEPSAIFETNNEIREIEYAEKREIIKILTVFTNDVRPETENLVSLYRFMGVIDFIRAKALFARDVAGVLPKIAQDPDPSSKTRRTMAFNWHQAIHPNLYLHFKKIKKEVVPLDLELEGEERILIISGPNAGGKSVCLTTVGLVQYMFQCGLLPPVREDSEFMIFEKIFIDIGDEQSIDNDLSTYTSKLLNLKFFLEQVDEHSLLLIDEYGSGTDPSQGGAMAEACLEEMAARGTYGVITTHYSNLKLLAGRVKGIVNGAMLYDSKKLKPLYRLKKGKPGNSFAFEIAAQIGFPPAVLNKARNITGHSQLNFEKQIQDLETEKDEMSRKSTELRVADDFLAELISKYEKLTGTLEKSKKDILDTARTEALQMVSEANRTIEKTIKEIKEAQAEKEQTKTARSGIKELKEKLEEQQAPLVWPEPPPEEVGTGKTSSAVKPKTQSPPKPQTIEPSGPPQRQYQSYLDDLHRKLYDFQVTLDLRGKRVDETISMLQKYIDDAIMLSIPEVRILHGKGNGVLRQVTRDYLRSVKEIKSAKDELLERGGSGITVVIFK